MTPDDIASRFLPASVAIAEQRALEQRRSAEEEAARMHDVVAYTRTCAGTWPAAVRERRSA